MFSFVIAIYKDLISIIFYSYNSLLQNQSSNNCYFYYHAHPIILMSKMRTQMFKRVRGIHIDDLISQLW